MNKKEYAEFHKYLAMLIYEYNNMAHSPNLCEETLNEISDILMALEKVMKICILENCRGEENESNKES